MSDAPNLLVSVRTVDEVENAILGGAGMIDVKEPTNGALGRADDKTVAAVVKQVAGRRPVSAALGELIEWGISDGPIPLDPSLAYAKIGLANCGRKRGWAKSLNDLRIKLESQGKTRLVAVAYADWRRADAPRPQEVISFALSNHCSAFLFDTWQKDGSTLLDWMTVSDLTTMCEHFRLAGVTVALSGSLGRWQIRQLLPARPEWFGVRGSACVGEGRLGVLNRERIERLAAVLTHPESIANDSRMDESYPELQNLIPPTEEMP